MEDLICLLATVRTLNLFSVAGHKMFVFVLIESLSSEHGIIDHTFKSID